MLGMFQDKDKVAQMVVSSLDPEKLKRVNDGGDVNIDEPFKEATRCCFNAFREGNEAAFTDALTNVFKMLYEKSQRQHEENGTNNNPYPG